VAFEVHNNGRTPGYIVEVIFKVFIYQAIPDVPDYSGAQSLIRGREVPQEGGITTIEYTWDVLEDTLFKDIMEGKAFFTVLGKIIYSDVFGFVSTAHFGMYYSRFKNDLRNITSPAYTAHHEGQAQPQSQPIDPTR
jgi:hypothetical protein